MKSIRIRHIIYGLLQYIGAFLLGIIFNRLIEILIIIPLFFIFRSRYEKTFHAKTMLECTLYTLLMFLIICLIARPIYESILLTIILCYVTTQILYYIKDYIDLLKVKNIPIYIGMNRDTLKQKCQIYGLNDIETDVLIMYYCDRMKRWQIGNKLGYSEDNISKIKKKALDKLLEKSKEALDKKV